MQISRKLDYPPKINNPDGEIIQEILGIQAGNVNSHSLAEVTIPPGKTSVSHFHKESEESYLILSGTATLKIDQAELTLTSGDAVLIEPHEIHQISNQSHQDLVFLAVCVPAWHPEDSFEVDITEVS